MKIEIKRKKEKKWKKVWFLFFDFLRSFFNYLGYAMEVYFLKIVGVEKVKKAWRSYKRVKKKYFYLIFIMEVIFISFFINYLFSFDYFLNRLTNFFLITSIFLLIKIIFNRIVESLLKLKFMRKDFDWIFDEFGWPERKRLHESSYRLIYSKELKTMNDYKEKVMEEEEKEEVEEKGWNYYTVYKRLWIKKYFFVRKTYWLSWLLNNLYKYNIFVFLLKFYHSYMYYMRYVRYFFFKLGANFIIYRLDFFLIHIVFEFIFSFFSLLHYVLVKEYLDKLLSMTWREFFQKRVYIFFIISMFFWVKSIIMLILINYIMTTIKFVHDKWLYEERERIYTGFPLLYTYFFSGQFSMLNWRFIYLNMDREKKKKYSWIGYHYDINNWLNLDPHYKNVLCYEEKYFDLEKNLMYYDMYGGVRMKEIIHINELIKWFIWYKFICVCQEPDWDEENDWSNTAKERCGWYNYEMANKLFIKPMEEVIKEIIKKLKKKGVKFKIKMEWKEESSYATKQIPLIKIEIEGFTLQEKDIILEKELQELYLLVKAFVMTKGDKEEFLKKNKDWKEKVKKVEQKFDNREYKSILCSGGYEYSSLWFGGEESREKYKKLIREVFKDTFKGYKREEGEEEKFFIHTLFEIENATTYIRQAGIIVEELVEEEKELLNKKYDVEKKWKRFKKYIHGL